MVFLIKRRIEKKNEEEEEGEGQKRSKDLM